MSTGVGTVDGDGRTGCVLLFLSLCLSCVCGVDVSTGVGTVGGDIFICGTDTCNGKVGSSGSGLDGRDDGDSGSEGRDDGVNDVQDDNDVGDDGQDDDNVGAVVETVDVVDGYVEDCLFRCCISVGARLAIG